MPYDDPILKELGGYFKAEEPGRRERAEAWATAIGLQKVDGLTPSQFLFDTARDHIEGRITQNQARRRICNYYAAKDETRRPDPEKEEADKVSERIVAVLNDGGFAFTPEYFISIHAKLFKDVLPTAGKIRSVNIRNALVRANFADYAHDVKREWGFLEAFFRNLLLGERNELKSRYLLIGLTEEDKQKIRELTEPGSRQNKAVRKKRLGKSGKKTVEAVWDLLKAHPNITLAGLTQALGITRSTIQKHIAHLKTDGRLRRVGPDKGGHWEALG